MNPPPKELYEVLDWTRREGQIPKPKSARVAQELCNAYLATGTFTASQQEKALLLIQLYHKPRG